MPPPLPPGCRRAAACPAHPSLLLLRVTPEPPEQPFFCAECQPIPFQAREDAAACTVLCQTSFASAFLPRVTETRVRAEQPMEPDFKILFKRMAPFPLSVFLPPVFPALEPIWTGCAPPAQQPCNSVTSSAYSLACEGGV